MCNSCSHIQAGLRCACGDDYGRYGLVLGCTVICPGDSRYKCGGFQANYIYYIPGKCVYSTPICVSMNSYVLALCVSMNPIA